VSSAAQELARRCDANVDAIVRVLFAIERARRQLLELMEQGTRWL
jgi:hypothetical protein